MANKFLLKAILLLNYINVIHNNFYEGSINHYLCKKKVLKDDTPFNNIVEFRYRHHLNGINEFRKNEFMKLSFDQKISFNLLMNSFFDIRKLNENELNKIVQSNLNKRTIFETKLTESISTTLKAIKFNIAPKDIDLNDLELLINEKNPENNLEEKMVLNNWKKELFELPITFFHRFSGTNTTKSSIVYSIYLPYLSSFKKECERDFKMPNYYQQMDDYLEEEPRAIYSRNLEKSNKVIEEIFKLKKYPFYKYEFGFPQEKYGYKICKKQITCAENYTCILLKKYGYQCVKNEFF